MFRYIRVQILYPCRAKCAWCSTHRKNPLFSRLHREGLSEAIHAFYVDVIRRFSPEQVFISGGEPLLHPDIAAILNAIADSTQQINLFTSYQWSAGERKRMQLDRMPLDKIVFCHTPIYFEPERWHKLTNGFPFDVYLDNVRFFARLPARKRFKFIINHSRFHEELQRFQQLVEPDRTCELSLKVMNNQGKGITTEPMARTRDRVNRRAAQLDELVKQAGWGRVGRKHGSIDVMLPLLEDGDVERCAYRNEPIELRFALDGKARDGKPVVRYRYCPYFPPDSGHRFHVGRDDPSKLERNYEKGSFRDHCGDCRFLAYYRGQPTCTAATPPPPSEEARG